MNRSERAYQTGDEGEEAIYKIIKGRGWDVKCGWLTGPDLIVEGHVTVEVKTANPTRRVDKNPRRWQFCLWKDDGEHKPFDEDILILRCLSEPPCHFIIPGCLITPGQKQLNITSPDPRDYRGKYAMFREAWELCDLLIAGELWLQTGWM